MSETIEEILEELIRLVAADELAGTLYTSRVEELVEFSSGKIQEASGESTIEHPESVFLITTSGIPSFWTTDPAQVTPATASCLVDRIEKTNEFIRATWADDSMIEVYMNHIEMYSNAPGDRHGRGDPPPPPSEAGDNITELFT